MSDPKTKTVKFNPDDPVQLELWEWLRKRPHGEFSEETREYWLKRMREEKERGK
jgi:hypothetical protein